MHFYHRYKYLILAILVLLFGKLTEWNILFPRFDNTYAQKFQKVFDNKERELQNYVVYIEKALKNTTTTQDLQNKLSRFYGLMEKEGFGIFVYKNDSLVYWSDNSVIVGNEFSFSKESSVYINLKNAWFVTKIKEIGKWKIVGLIQIKQVYHYENRYLVNEFQRDFNFPSTVKISSRQVPDGYPVFNSDGMYIFSLVFDKSCEHPWFQLYIPVISYFLFIIFLGFFLCNTLSHISNLGLKRNLIIAVILLSLTLKYITSIYHFPAVFYQLDLFDPQNMAISPYIPSMGDLLLWAMVIFFSAYLLFKNLRLFPIRIKNKYNRFLVIVASSILITGTFMLLNLLVKSMVLNSSISLEAHKVLLLNSYSFLGYIILIMVFVSWGFLADRISVIISDFSGFNNYAAIFISVATLLHIILFLFTKSIDILPYIFMVALVLLIGFFRIKQRTAYQFSGLVLVVLIFALYTVDRIIELSLQKNRNETYILASNLANQHDQVAEFLLEESSVKLKKDSVITGFLFSSNPQDNKMSQYIANTYFDGYLDKYALQIIYCYQYDSLYLMPPDNQTVHCRSYFLDKVNTAGVKLPSSDYYYIDNQNGRVSYLGWFEYPVPETQDTVTLFIELDSKVITDELGYPELLLDKKVSQRSMFKDYSYAKYFNGLLVNKHGYYPYDLSSKDFSTKDSVQFSSKKLNGFNHLIYNINPQDIIVISYPKVGFFEILIAFSWVFLFYLLIITFVSVFTNLPLIQKAFRPDFKNKIQFSIMSVLFSSLILIGGGTIIFSIKQYNNRHYATLEEKMKSIYIEVVQKIGNERKIEQVWHDYNYNNLNELLVKFSNVFYADINLFDPKGNIVATSRPEIFEKGLIGLKINPSAYNELAFNKRSQYIHNEKIGRLSYLSGYIPLLNHENELMAYLNIPYFTRQEELMHEVSNLVVGIVNVYVILLLISILISILISRRITMPLRMIQEKFSKIKLVQRYDTIEYVGDDEIGGLVKEYNRMVKELERSIKMLAKSERESAWREMARQIAHEINNPLTPMKLSVQHLLRAHKDKSDKFDEYLERISKTLIEEIDNLSSIATEFSNFAKMPKAHNLRFNLVEKINTVVNLFSNSEADFIVNFNNHTDIEIFADKEQISRVFINLFKNAIQAIEKGNQPVISITLSVENDRAVVRVSDNGYGIPEELRDKLFRPNFTTKTSGMGLGLAIIKNIMEDIGGSIRFVTETGNGTTFILEFPVFKDKKLVGVK